MERKQVGLQPVKKQTNLRGAIAVGAAGAAIGGMLGAAAPDFALEGSIIGGLLGVIAGLLLNGEQKKNFPTDKQVDMYFDTHPILKRYVEDKFKRGLKVEGHLHFLSNDEFVEEYTEYITQHINVKTRVHYTEEEAKERALRANAYLSRGKIYINQNKAHASTVIHEAVHLFQDRRYGYELDINKHCGTTEYFTRLLCDSHLQLTRHPKYPKQSECIEKLLRACC
jgi:hypothetical protein